MARDLYEDHDDTAPKKDGLASGLVILTTLLLIGAWLVMEKARGEHFNQGVFKDSSASSGE